MLNRRQMFKRLVRMGTAIWALVGVDLVRVNSALARGKKRLLPAHTDLQTLRNANPKYLDTRHLPLMPLEEFETMGEVRWTYDPEKWQLTVEGRVARSLSLSYETLLARPLLTRNVLLICPGVFVNHGRWSGISLGALLREAQPASDAKWVIFHTDSGTDKRKERFAIAEVNADIVFLAHTVNGQRLPEKHGYPLRVVAEGHYGDTWAKYVRRVEVV